MTTLLSHTGHRQRLQKRIEDNGFDTLLDHEFLELLLTCSIPRKDTKPIAWTLLHRFGSIAGALDANESALLDVPGIGPKTARHLKLVRESFKRYTRAQLSKQIKLSTLEEVLDYCNASLSGRKEEFLEIIFLSIRCTFMYTRTLSTGSISQITLEPRRIIEEVIKAKASGFILVHNHPSGDPSPSEEDIKWTKKLEASAKVFGITLWEHFIMASSGHFSFRQNNILEPPPSQG